MYMYGEDYASSACLPLDTSSHTVKWAPSWTLYTSKADSNVRRYDLVWYYKIQTELLPPLSLSFSLSLSLLQHYVCASEEQFCSAVPQLVGDHELGSATNDDDAWQSNQCPYLSVVAVLVFIYDQGWIITSINYYTAALGASRWRCVVLFVCIFILSLWSNTVHIMISVKSSILNQVYSLLF